MAGLSAKVHFITKCIFRIFFTVFCVLFSSSYDEI